MVTRRWAQGAVGVVLLVAGLAAASALTGATAWGVPGDTSRAAALETSPQEHRDAMEQLMDAVHGPGTAESLRDVDGVDEMMDTCAAMMTAMPMMGGMMGRDGMTAPGMGGMMGREG